MVYIARNLWLLGGICCVLSGDVRAGGIDAPTRQDTWWALAPMVRATPPEVRGEALGPIDRFLLVQLQGEGLDFAPPAPPAVLVRRLHFDLTGLPPTPEAIARYAADPRPDRWQRLVDRLLASPHYGERWGRHWLDVVRYAESDGFRADDYRPQAWRYRDWVIRSLNEDKPFDRFVIEQLSGDEQAPDDSEALIATGFLRLWPYEHNQRDVHRQWDDILNDITDVTADAFLGISMRCARCHDHKFDPVPQKDYYRLRAFFEAILPDDPIVATSRGEVRRYESELAAWKEAARDVLAKIETIETPVRKKLHRPAIEKFMPRYQELLAKDFDKLSPGDQQIYHLAYQQLLREERKLEQEIPEDQQAEWTRLREELKRFDARKPSPLTPILAVKDIGPEAPPTRMRSGGEEVIVEPGFLTRLDSKPARLSGAGPATTGRRSTLARWIAHRNNPLTARVIVNRLVHYHFGRGIVRTPNDFGGQGEPPTHPELLDWLALELVESGWSLKAIHRGLVTSRAYRQSAWSSEWDRDKTVLERDRSNRWFSRMPVRRLEGEVARDALAFVSGDLDRRLYGPAADEGSRRRSIYLKVRRNHRAAFFDAFDFPDTFNSCAQRNETTTAPQALLLLNQEWVRERAVALARRLEARLPQTGGDDRAAAEAIIRRGYELAFGRAPTASEVETFMSFFSAEDDRSRAVEDFAHVLCNANEFLYVD